MLPNPRMDLFSADEIAAAAGISERLVVAAIGGADALVPFADAARIGRALVAQRGGAAHQPLPPIVAPVVAVPSDTRSRVGVMEQTPAPADSHGPGQGGGAGTGTGTGLGEGEGAGIGAGSGGGTGGGPYRPGSGIDPPRLLR